MKFLWKNSPSTEEGDHHKFNFSTKMNLTSTKVLWLLIQIQSALINSNFSSQNLSKSSRQSVSLFTESKPYSKSTLNTIFTLATIIDISWVRLKHPTLSLLLITFVSAKKRLKKMEVLMLEKSNPVSQELSTISLVQASARKTRKETMDLRDKF